MEVFVIHSAGPQRQENIWWLHDLHLL